MRWFRHAPTRNATPAALCARRVATVCLLAAATQLSASEPVSVRVVEEQSDFVVIEYRLGGFEQRPVTIQGRPHVHLHLGNESPIMLKGAPELPNVCRSVVIPDDARMAVCVQDASFCDVQDMDIAPSKGVLPRSIDPRRVPYEFGDVYRVDAFYPGEIATLRDPYILRDCRGAVVELNPFQYNPVTRMLRVCTHAVLRVQRAGDGLVNVRRERLRSGRESTAFRQIYQHHFLNGPKRVRYPVLDEAGDMLIICHDPWLPNIQPLIVHKAGLGITATAVGVSTIGNTAGAIKSYIRSVYDTSDLAFVLLVGDAGEIATPTVTVGWEDGSADPTYALLDGNDPYPDVLVGRFSAQSAAHVDTQVLRTIEYENLPRSGGLWRKHGVGIGSDEGEGIGDDGELDREHIDNIRYKLLDYGYMHVDPFYDPGASALPVTAALNQGRGFINYAGHGGPSGWSTTGFSNSDVNALTNDNMLPFIVSVACNNGTFDGYTCFGETWLRATSGSEPTGAMGMYASSVGQHWAPPMCAQDAIADLLCAESYMSFGTLCFAGSCQMIDEYDTEGVEMFQTWHVFGDPSVRVYRVTSGLRAVGNSLITAGRAGGPFDPNGVTYTLENLNDDPIDYEVTTAATWVDITNASGTLPANSTTDVTVALNAEACALGHGLVEDTLQFVNLTDHDGDNERPMAIDVDATMPQYTYPLDSDPGWSCEGQWAFGQPVGGGTYPGDPASGHTGDYVYGYNLAGDYTGGMTPCHLTMPPFDCSNLDVVQLRFWRWLGVEMNWFDVASVSVSNDGAAWDVIWSNGGTDILDSEWTFMKIDISQFAAGNPTVHVRWTMGPTDDWVDYYGWNIDDVEIWGVSSGPAPLTGDLNCDTQVDFGDINPFVLRLIDPPAYAAQYPNCPDQNGDIDGNGSVGFEDINPFVDLMLEL